MRLREPAVVHAAEEAFLGAGELQRVAAASVHRAQHRPGEAPRHAGIAHGKAPRGIAQHRRGPRGVAGGEGVQHPGAERRRRVGRGLGPARITQRLRGIGITGSEEQHRLEARRRLAVLRRANLQRTQRAPGPGVVAGARCEGVLEGGHGGAQGFAVVIFYRCRYGCGSAHGGDAGCRRGLRRRLVDGGRGRRRGRLDGELGPVEETRLAQRIERRAVVRCDVGDPVAEGSVGVAGDAAHAGSVAVLGDDDEGGVGGAEERPQRVAAHRRNEPSIARNVEVLDAVDARVAGYFEGVRHARTEPRDVGPHALAQHPARPRWTFGARDGEAREVGLGQRLDEGLQREKLDRVEEPQLGVARRRGREAQRDGEARGFGARAPGLAAGFEARGERVVEGAARGLGVDPAPGSVGVDEGAATLGVEGARRFGGQRVRDAEGHAEASAAVRHVGPHALAGLVAGAQQQVRGRAREVHPEPRAVVAVEGRHRRVVAAEREQSFDEALRGTTAARGHEAPLRDVELRRRRARTQGLPERVRGAFTDVREVLGSAGNWGEFARVAVEGEGSDDEAFGGEGAGRAGVEGRAQQHRNAVHRELLPAHVVALRKGFGEGAERREVPGVVAQAEGEGHRWGVSAPAGSSASSGPRRPRARCCGRRCSSTSGSSPRWVPQGCR